MLIPNHLSIKPKNLHPKGWGIPVPVSVTLHMIGCGEEVVSSHFQFRKNLGGKLIFHGSNQWQPMHVHDDIIDQRHKHASLKPCNCPILEFRRANEFEELETCGELKGSSKIQIVRGYLEQNTCYSAICFIYLGQDHFLRTR